MVKYILPLLIILIAGNVSASPTSIHAEWGYTPPTSPAVKGYNLYMEAVKSCTFTGATTMSGDCTVDITKDITVFELTAEFVDGSESAKSSPYSFDRTKDATKPVIKSIIVR